MGGASFPGDHLCQSVPWVSWTRKNFSPNSSYSTHFYQAVISGPDRKSDEPLHTNSLLSSKPYLVKVENQMDPENLLSPCPQLHLYWTNADEDIKHTESIFDKFCYIRKICKKLSPCWFSHLKCLKSDWMSRLIFPPHPKFILFEACCETKLNCTDVLRSLISK